MILRATLTRILAAEVLLVAAVVVVMVVHDAWQTWARRVDLPRLGKARAALVPLLGEGEAAEVAPPLPRLPIRVSLRLVTELAPSLQGSGRQRLAEAAESWGLLARARRWCTSPWWWRRLRGAHLMAILGVAEDRLTQLIGDRHPLVRARAIEWAGDGLRDRVGGADLVARVAGHLADPAPICRHAARVALLRTGPLGAGAIARRLGAGVDAQTETLLDLAARRPDAAFLPAALELAQHPRRQVRARAARLLGALGGPAAVETLATLLEDDAPEVRAAAAGAVGHLRHWPLASAVAGRMADPGRAVRLAAGEALVALGAPGLLLLRRSAQGEDPEVRALALHMIWLAQLREEEAAGRP